MSTKATASGGLGLPLKEVLAKPWAQLNSLIILCDENELRKLMAIERDTTNRLSVLLRLHGRYNKLRAAREREELRRG